MSDITRTLQLAKRISGLVAPEWARALSVDPSSLLADDTIEGALELMAQGAVMNTKRSYAAAAHYWEQWFCLRYGVALTFPVTVTAVITFVVDHAEREGRKRGERVYGLPPEIDARLVEGGVKSGLGAMSMSWIRHRVAVLSKAHEVAGLKNPTKDGRVRELLKAASRAHVLRGDVAQKKPALAPDDLQRMLDTCDETLVGIRDRAMLLFAFSSGGRRRSEVSGAKMEYLTELPNGLGYTYRVAISKTNPDGKDRPSDHKPVVGPAADALRAWLNKSGVTKDAIFRRLYRGGRVGLALSEEGLNDVVKKRAKKAGLKADLSAHSIRAGFITAAGHHDVSMSVAMAMTGHKTAAVFQSYFRGIDPESRAAHLFELGRDDEADADADADADGRQ